MASTASASAVSDETFAYTELPDAADYIRLLTVLKAPKDGIVEFQITPWSISQAPSYIAISYTWGNAKDSKHITLNGKSFRVGDNCAYALRQAINFDSAQTYWIDAICIDQDNETEKGKQVFMMGELFAKAELVLSCIGPHADNSQLAFQTLKRFDRLLNSSKAYESFPMLELDQYFWRWFFRVKSSDLFALWTAVNLVTKRPYFTRSWVVQEIAMARDLRICCGMDVCRQNQWLSMLTYLEYEGEIQRLAAPVFASRFIRALAWYRRRAATNGFDGNLPTWFDHRRFLRLHSPDGAKTLMTLSELMRFISDFECQDPRDRLYSTLRLVDWGDTEPPGTDYGIAAFDLGLNIGLRMSSDFLDYEWNGLYAFSRIAAVLRLEPHSWRLDHADMDEGNCRPSPDKENPNNGPLRCKMRMTPLETKMIEGALSVWYQSEERPFDIDDLPEASGCHPANPLYKWRRYREDKGSISATSAESHRKYFNYGDYCTDVDRQKQDLVLFESSYLPMVIRTGQDNMYDVIAYIIREDIQPWMMVPADVEVSFRPADLLRYVTIRTVSGPGSASIEEHLSDLAQRFEPDWIFSQPRLFIRPRKRGNGDRGHGLFRPCVDVDW